MLSTAHQMHGAARLVNAVVIPAGNRSSLMPYSRVIRILKIKTNCDLFHAIELLLFARIAVRMGLDPAPTSLGLELCMNGRC
jgi:phenylacetate-CoA ligase